MCDGVVLGPRATQGRTARRGRWTRAEAHEIICPQLRCEAGRGLDSDVTFLVVPAHPPHDRLEEQRAPQPLSPCRREASWPPGIRKMLLLPCDRVGDCSTSIAARGPRDRGKKPRNRERRHAALCALTSSSTARRSASIARRDCASHRPSASLKSRSSGSMNFAALAIAPGPDCTCGAAASGRRTRNLPQKVRTGSSRALSRARGRVPPFLDEIAPPRRAAAPRLVPHRPHESADTVGDSTTVTAPAGFERAARRVSPASRHPRR